MKKLIARILVLTMLVAMTSGMALAANFDDMPSDWSTAALEAAVNNGLLKGNNGKIMPKAFLTRAQMAAIVGRAFGATEKASLTAFADVSTSKWYYDDLAKAVQMKVLQGDGNRLKPDSNITREEAFVVLARAFKLSGAKDDMLNHFSDKDKVSSWAKDGVAVLVAAGYVSGANGKLNPKQNITRAEFAQIMHNLLSVYVTEAGNFSHDVAGNVMVNTPNAVLKNMTITGNLIIGDGVGDGDVTLENVKVTGTTLVRGGGVNSIRIMGNTSMQNLVIARVNGEVRVFAENGTQVGTVVADGNDDVIIEGKVGSVIVEADGITVTAKNATITSATVFGDGSKIIAGGSTAITAVVVNAANSEIVTEKGATIGKIEINEDGAKVSGAGTVGTVAANANDVVVTTPGTNVTAGAETTGVVAGDKPVTGGSTVTTPGTTTGGGSYVPTPTPDPVLSATFSATGNIDIVPDGEAAGKIYVEYKLIAEGKDISLSTDNVKSVRMKFGSTGWYTLPVTKDATRWFNMESNFDVLTYEVETKDGKKYQAALNWEIEFKAAAWAATGVKGLHDGKTYVEYKLQQNETEISLATGNVKLIAQKVDGKWTKLQANEDETLWFNEARETGNYDFFVVTSEGTMYKATLNWEKPDTTAPTFVSITPAAGKVTLTDDETFILKVKASDANLYELEVDHSMGALPEFSVYADEKNPYGDAKGAFETAKVTVFYDATAQEWTIDFGKTATKAIVANHGITFYLVISDEAGNAWGSMYEVTDVNTFVYEVTAIKTVADVSDLAGLQSALATENIKTINITADITATAPVEVKREVTINGGGHMLTVTGLVNLNSEITIDDALIIYNATTINNLTVDAGLATPQVWCGTYAIHVYDTEATLNNVTVKNGNGGILVNGADVTLTGTINVSGNGYGGIEVSKGVATGYPGLTISKDATFINTTEAYGLPTIWIDGDGGVAGDDAFTVSNTIKAGQWQYYLVADTATLLKLAKAYEYEDKYAYTGTSIIGENTITYTAPATAFTVVGGDANTRATMDLARLLGALYRINDGKSVASITYGATKYTWNSSGEFEGSNWMNGETTLVSAIVSYIEANQTKLPTDGVTFDLLINSTTVTFTVQIRK